MENMLFRISTGGLKLVLDADNCANFHANIAHARGVKLSAITSPIDNTPSGCRIISERSTHLSLFHWARDMEHPQITN